MRRGIIFFFFFLIATTPTSAHAEFLKNLPLSPATLQNPKLNPTFPTPERDLEQECLDQGKDYFFDSDTEECSRKVEASILWQGFHHEWKKTPHRLNRFGSYIRDIEYDEKTDTVSGEHRSIFKVGAYNDTGTVKSTGTFVKSGVLGLYEGSVDESCLIIQEDVGYSDSVYCRQSINLKDIGFKSYDQVTVVLRGFQLNSQTYSAGYNTRGFTVRVIPKIHTDDTFEFDAMMSIHAEHAPDRPQLDDKCWQDSHCRFYRYTGRIYYTIIGVKSEDGALTEPGSDATNAYSQYVKMSPNEVPDQASEATRTAKIFGEEGFEDGLVAIQGFRWHLNNWNGTSKDGRYLRDIEMNISHIDYDPASGDAEFLTNMYFSNSGLFPMGFDVDFEMWNTLIQVNDDGFDRSNKEWFDGTVDKNSSDFVETVEYGF